MPAYMIATRIGPVRDAAALAEYSRLNRENAATFQSQYNVKPLVVYGAMEAAEGPAIFALPEATLLVTPGWHARVTGDGTIELVRS